MTDKPKPIIPGVEWEKRGSAHFVCKVGRFEFTLWRCLRNPPTWSAEVDLRNVSLLRDHYRDIEGAWGLLATWHEQHVEQLTGGELGGLRRSNAELLDAVDEIKSERDAALARVAELEAAHKSPDRPLLEEHLGAELDAMEGICQQWVDAWVQIAKEPPALNFGRAEGHLHEAWPRGSAQFFAGSNHVRDHLFRAALRLMAAASAGMKLLESKEES